jgi:hypothetical protein
MRRRNRRSPYGLRERRVIMDCRVKPGNDGGEIVPFVQSRRCSIAAAFQSFARST